MLRLVETVAKALGKARDAALISFEKFERQQHALGAMMTNYRTVILPTLLRV
jgi:hypothetical protein